MESTSAAMLARARQLAEAQELHHVSFEEGDAQVHPLAPAYFDIAISRYGTMFFRDPVAAFRNIRGALVPGGRLVMMVWQDPAANEWSTSIQRCLASDGLEPIVSMEGLDPFSLSDPTKVERILTEAGFAETSFMDVCEPVYYGENVDVAIEWVRRFLFVRELLQRLDAASAERTLERLRELFAAHDGGSGVWFDARAMKPGRRLRRTRRSTRGAPARCSARRHRRRSDLQQRARRVPPRSRAVARGIHRNR